MYSPVQNTKTNTELEGFTKSEIGFFCYEREGTIVLYRELLLLGLLDPVLEDEVVLAQVLVVELADDLD